MTKRTVIRRFDGIRLSPDEVNAPHARSFMRGEVVALLEPTSPKEAIRERFAVFDFDGQRYISPLEEFLAFTESS